MSSIPFVLTTHPLTHAPGATWRVIKLGGSLLDFPELRSALRRWRAVQPAARDVLIVGGGELVEAIRRLDRSLTLGEEAAHWLCVRAMSLTVRLAAAVWPELILVAQRSELMDAAPTGRDPVAFDVEDFLRREEPTIPGPPLPRDWSVTSDSIAARVAQALGAGELVLLKSTLPDCGTLSCQEAAARGYVDPFFPRAAAALPHVRAVDLRSPDFRELLLTA